MPVSIATFQSDLEKLIRKFEADQQHYSSKNYLEAQARMDREIAATDAGIDDLVYELYGITDEEKEIISGDGR